MHTYITILRGINVSGQKLIKMEALRKMLEGLHLKNVKTYIQSGNVVFDTEASDITQLQKQIEDGIKETFGFDVPVIVIEKEELEDIIKANSFVHKSDIDLTRVHVTFLSSTPDREMCSKIDGGQYLPDEFIISNRAIYLHLPGGYGNTKLSNNFFEKKLKVTATTRNWRTVNELLNIAENLAK